MTLGLGDEPGQHQKLTPLRLGEPREMRAIRLDGAEHAHASLDVVLG
jgi:hypothetical protein